MQTCSVCKLATIIFTVAKLTMTAHNNTHFISIYNALLCYIIMTYNFLDYYEWNRIIFLGSDTHVLPDFPLSCYYQLYDSIFEWQLQHICQMVTLYQILSHSPIAVRKTGSIFVPTMVIALSLMMSVNVLLYLYLMNTLNLIQIFFHMISILYKIIT